MNVYAWWCSVLRFRVLLQTGLITAWTLHYAENMQHKMPHPSALLQHFSGQLSWVHFSDAGVTLVQLLDVWKNCSVKTKVSSQIVTELSWKRRFSVGLFLVLFLLSCASILYSAFFVCSVFWFFFFITGLNCFLLLVCVWGEFVNMMSY